MFLDIGDSVFEISEALGKVSSKEVLAKTFYFAKETIRKALTCQILQGIGAWC